MIETLRQFEPFADLDWTTLMTVARHAREIEIPANRWLIRPGQNPTGSFFLLRGKVKTLDPDGVVNARMHRRPIYPGVAGLLTISPCRWLRVDTLPIAFLLDGTSVAALPSSGTHDWEIKFLQSHMMTDLSPMIWQQILRDLQPRQYASGQVVVEEGGDAACSYIVAGGRAVVHRGDLVLRELGPGDFFGEDALLTGGPRNASVTMLTPGRLMELELRCFQVWLERLLVHGEGAAENPGGLGSEGAKEQLQVPGWEGVTEVRGMLERLDPCCSYIVGGEVPKICAMAVFLLRQRGIRAWVAARDVIDSTS